MKNELLKEHIIYMITNKTNNKCYIGSAVNGRKRKNDHINLLRNGKHYNDYLQKAFNKYGEEKFEFKTLQIINDKNNLISQEQYWMDVFRPEYNIAPKAGSTLGVKCTEEARQKNRESNSGEKNAMWGKHHSKKTRDKISLSLKGKPGRKHTDETKEKISKKNKGRKLSEQTKINISRSRLGKGVRGVIQYDKLYNFISEYHSLVEAGDITHIGEMNIHACCAGRQSTAGGFIWKYSDDNKNIPTKVMPKSFDLDLIKNSIQKSKKSLYKIANETGISLITMKNMINNISDPSNKTIYKLSEYFRIELKSYLGFEVIIGESV